MNNELPEKPIPCYKCGTLLPYEPRQKIMRGDECPKCSVSIRSCKFCLHFEPSAYNQCREMIAERVLDKDKANFCNYFVFDLNSSNSDKKLEEQVNSANSLFKD